MVGQGGLGPFIAAGARSNTARRERYLAGIAWARDWRRRTKPHFDALYGPDERDHPSYGGWMQAEAAARAGKVVSGER